MIVAIHYRRGQTHAAIDNNILFCFKTGRIPFIVLIPKLNNIYIRIVFLISTNLFVMRFTFRVYIAY